MRITRGRLKRIINEELSRVLNKESYLSMDPTYRRNVGRAVRGFSNVKPLPPAALPLIALAEITVVWNMLAWEGEQAHTLWKTLNKNTQAAAANAFVRAIHRTVAEAKTLLRDKSSLGLKAGNEAWDKHIESEIELLKSISRKFRAASRDLSPDDLEIVQDWASHPEIKPHIISELEPSRIQGNRDDINFDKFSDMMVVWREKLFPPTAKPPSPPLS
jgi:hypothetical protein